MSNYGNKRGFKLGLCKGCIKNKGEWHFLATILAIPTPTVKQHFTGAFNLNLLLKDYALNSDWTPQLLLSVHRQHTNIWNRGHVIKQRCVCVCVSCRLMNVCLTHSTAAVSRANVTLTHSLPTAICLSFLFYEPILFLPGLTVSKCSVTCKTCKICSLGIYLNHLSV